MKLDLNVLLHQISRLMVFLWAVMRPDDYKAVLFIREADYPEIERFDMPDGKIIKVTIEYVDEEEGEYEPNSVYRH